MSNRAKSMYRSQILSETAKSIFTEQEEVVREWNLIDSGHLLEELRKEHFQIEDFETGGRLIMRVLTYMRLLDQKGIAKGSPRRKAYHLYNKIIFGYVYNKTLPALKYGFTADVRAQINEKLQGVWKSDNDGKKIFITKEMEKDYNLTTHYAFKKL